MKLELRRSLSSTSFSDIPRNRIVGMNTVIYGNDGQVYFIEKLAECTGQDCPSHGGNTDLYNQSGT